jgi:copper chaperone
MTMIEISVNDMTCGHCASAITRAVKEVDATGRCDVDLRAKTVRIESGEPVEAFVQAIGEAGYTPVVASATS